MADDPVQRALSAAAAVRAPAPRPPQPPVDYSKPDELGMHSHGAVLASRMPIAKGTPQQIKGYLTKNGVKPDEFKWSGYDEKLGGKPSVTREEVAKHFHENRPAIKEYVLHGGEFANLDDDERPGDAAKFEQYTLPGGKNYREHLLKLPTAMQNYNKFSDVLREKYGPGGFNNLPLTPDERARLDHLMNRGEDEPYRSSHWEGHPNVLTHLRLSDRHVETPRNGFVAYNKKSQNRSDIFDTEEQARDYIAKMPAAMRDQLATSPINSSTKQKLLHLEELQSEWAQEGRSKGFRLPPEMTAPMDAEYRQLVHKNAAAHAAGTAPQVTDVARAKELEAHLLRSDSSKIPHAPYVDSTSKWLDLGLKRALWEAAKGGHSKLLITPGEEQAKRYDLSKHVDKVNLLPDPSGKLRVEGYKDNEKILEHFAENEKDLAGVVGKEVAEKLLNSRNQHGAATVAGQDLKVGGEGMKGFYDHMLPQALQKLARRHDPEAEVKLHGHELRDPAYKREPGYRVMTGGANGEPMHESHFITPQGAERRRQEFIAQGHPADALTVEPVHPATKVHSLDITPRMRASILKGQPAYASGGAVGGTVERKQHVIDGKIHHLYERVEHPEPEVPSLARGGIVSRPARKRFTPRAEARLDKMSRRKPDPDAPPFAKGGSVKGFAEDVPRDTGSIVFVPELDRMFGDNSQIIGKQARQHTRATGNEAMGFGDHQTLSALTKGIQGFVKPPESFPKWASKQDRAFFTLHTHPSGSMHASEGDIDYRHMTNPDHHYMMIEAHPNPHNRTVVAPLPKTGLGMAAGNRYSSALPITTRAAWAWFQELNKSMGLRERDPTMAGSLINAANARRGVPVFMDSRTRPVGGANTAEEMLPEYINYLKQKAPGDTPFARGGRVEHDPSEAQKAAGNYSKGHLSFQGVPIAIENRKGSTRRGVDANGKHWSCVLPADYGYIKRTVGADGDHVDVYVGPDRSSPIAFIINQHNHKTNRFDEHKIVLGTRSEREARALFCAAFSDGNGPRRLGSLEPISVDALKDWLKTGKTVKPARTSALVEHALRIAAGARA